MRDFVKGKIYPIIGSIAKDGQINGDKDFPEWNRKTSNKKLHIDKEKILCYDIYILLVLIPFNNFL